MYRYMRIAALSVVLLAACTRASIDEPAPHPVREPVDRGAPPIITPPATAAPSAPAAIPANVYPWLDDPTSGVAAPEDTLEDRFAPPGGFVRAGVAGGSFGAWLRRL